MRKSSFGARTWRPGERQDRKGTRVAFLTVSMDFRRGQLSQVIYSVASFLTQETKTQEHKGVFPKSEGWGRQ